MGMSTRPGQAIFSLLGNPSLCFFACLGLGFPFSQGTPALASLAAMVVVIGTYQ
jgi:hypothetical protein